MTKMRSSNMDHRPTWQRDNLLVTNRITNTRSRTTWAMVETLEQILKKEKIRINSFTLISMTLDKKNNKEEDSQSHSKKFLSIAKSSFTQRNLPGIKIPTVRPTNQNLTQSIWHTCKQAILTNSEVM